MLLLDSVWVTFPIGVFLLCILWLCDRSGLLEQAQTYYVYKTKDYNWIVVPAFAALILPFVLTSLLQDVLTFLSSHDTDSSIKYALSAAATVAVFLGRQEYEIRTAAIQKRREQDIAFYLMHAEIELSMKYQERNQGSLEMVFPQKEATQLPGYPLLDVYEIKDLSSVLRKYPRLLNERELLEAVKASRLQTAEYNKAVQLWNTVVVSSRKVSHPGKQEHVHAQLTKIKAVLDPADEKLTDLWSVVAQGIRPLVYQGSI